MIKKLLSTLLLVPALAIAEVDVVHFESICSNYKTIGDSLVKHGELPFTTAIGHRMDGNKKVFHPVITFVNPKTKTWTVVEKIDSETYCIIAVGSKLEPFIDDK